MAAPTRNTPLVLGLASSVSGSMFVIGVVLLIVAVARRSRAIRQGARSLRLLLIALVVSGCVHAVAPQAGQLVLVTSADWSASTGTLRRFERDAGGWREVGAGVPVMLGRNGSAWGVGLHPAQGEPVKREGDGKSPAGVFEIGEGFGYAERASTGLNYVPMVKESWCVDVSGSPLYNRIVDARQVGEDAIKGSSEPMRRDLQPEPDDAYRLGFVVRHNASGAPNAGSCIFVHQQRIAGKPTAGCTALEPGALDALFAWLDAKRKPVFVLLPQVQYEALRGPWGLP